MNDYYTFIGYITLEVLGLLFIKLWGKKVIPTFFSGGIFFLIIANYGKLFDNETKLNIITPIVSTGSFLLLIYLSSKRLSSEKHSIPYNYKLIYKEYKVYYSIIASLILGIISFLINKNKTSVLHIKDYYYVFLTITILPILFEFFLHIIIWDLILKKNSLVYRIILYILTTGVAIWLSCIDWGVSLLLYITASITLIISGLLSLFCRRNFFWLNILIRSFFYFIAFSFI